MISVFNIIFIIMSIIVAIGIGVGIYSVISPKFRGKLLSRQVKATKYMMEESFDDEFFDTLEDLSTKSAKAGYDARKISANAIKKGFETEDIVYCKYCGSVIDSDSVFCKKCGKQQ